MLTLAKFARKKGSKDKKKRKSRLLRNIAMGVGGVALLGGGAYLGRKKIIKAGQKSSKVGDTGLDDISVAPTKYVKLSSAERRANRVAKLKEEYGEDVLQKIAEAKKDFRKARREFRSLLDKRDALVNSDDHKAFTGVWGDIYRNTPKYKKHFKELKKLEKEIEPGNVGWGLGATKADLYNSINSRHAHWKYDLIKSNRRLRRENPAIYSSRTEIAVFSQNKSTMMSLASFNRKWK